MCPRLGGTDPRNGQVLAQCRDRVVRRPLAIIAPEPHLLIALEPVLVPRNLLDAGDETGQH